MSMCTCDNCSRYIDSDFDPDYFVHDWAINAPKDMEVVCEVCRAEMDITDEPTDEMLDDHDGVGL